MSKSEFLHYLPKILAVMVLVIAGIALWAYAGPKKEIAKSRFMHPEWAKNAMIYEVNIRQYTPEGTFKAFEQHLPRLKSMGVDILWLMPVNPIGVKNRKGTLGSYYSIRDYVGVNPEFGTLNDFKELVKKAHGLGMHVIIDWVANHSSWDNVLVAQHPDWYTHDSSGKIIPPVADWTDVADLNYDKPELREYMTNALIWWVKETDIDGFRCDVAGMVPVSFWNKAVPRVKAVKHVFMLAEWETPDMHDTAFDMTYSWDVYHLMNDIAKGVKTADAFDSLLAAESSKFPADAYRMRFTSNHDENSWNGTEFERMGNAAQAFAVLCYTLPGMPLIYSGQESGFNRRLKFFDKDTIEWDHFRLAEFYTNLNKIKKTNPALANGADGGTMIKIESDNNKNIYCFLRVKEKNVLLVLFNLSPSSQSATLKVKVHTGHYEELLSNGSFNLNESSIVNLKPWEYRIYLKEE
ncbi:MAG: alpha-amylase family glycosyl hydrolase [Bacteroidetes bacterium]|nr:alpha-amylase family glycosyl hydrolase [Bacteroidota bacterium]